MKIDQDRLIFPTESQVHVIRHFTLLDDAYLQELIIQTDLSYEFIASELRSEGSKFDPAFVKNPLQLLDKLSKAMNTDMAIKTFRGENKVDVMIEYPYPVGTEGVIAINELSDQEKGSIRQIKYHETIVKKANILKTRNSNQANMVLLKIDDFFQLLTIFPGSYAPAFPDEEKQTPKDYQLSVDFWERHVFV